MNKSTLQCISKLSVIILLIIGLAELGLALWTVFDDRYKILAYYLADVGYIDLSILRYLSLCLFASSIITLVMCLILIWGLCSAHIFLFIASTMITIVFIGELTIAILTFTSKYQTRTTLLVQLPKLATSGELGTDERAKRALVSLELTFRCCGSNDPLRCRTLYIGCSIVTSYFLDATMDSLAFVLLFFSLMKFFIIIFFYSYLGLNQKHRNKRLESSSHLIEDDSIWRHSSSFNSSPTDTSQRKHFVLPSIKTDEENQSEYHCSSSPPNSPRKLSAISERTERNEPDEIDLSRSRYYQPKHSGYITTIVQRKYPPIKTRRKFDENDDSGVEHSSSEKSFDGHKPTSLSFSKVFVTSVSQVQPTDIELKQSLTTSTSDSLLTHKPKSILKKPNRDRQRIPLLINSPKPTPRKTLKQDESPF